MVVVGLVECGVCVRMGPPRPVGTDLPEQRIPCARN